MEDPSDMSSRIRGLFRAVAWAIVVAAPGGTAAPAAERPPNLVVVLTDDMGYADLPAFGDSEIPTPHIDQLAREGTRCTSAYVAAPICVPSRMAILTGRYPSRFGMYDNVYGETQNRLWLAQTTIADVLKSGGYRTAAIGKWHLSGNGGFEYGPPHARGFDEFVGITGGMSDYTAGTTLVRLREGQYEPFAAPAYLTDTFGAEACEFIRRNTDQPFFLYLAFNAPHAPLDAGEDDKQAGDATFTSPARRTYAGMVHAIDRNVGAVMATLREQDLDRTTLVVFLNDNGGGGNNSAGHTRNAARNLPFRGHKFDLWEGGIRVPFIARWPGRIPAGHTCAGVVSSMDILPTFAAAAGMKSPAGIDGVDLLPFIEGRETGDSHASLQWKQRIWSRPNERKPGLDVPKPAYAKAIRQGTWKAIRQDQPFDGESQERPWELYDIARDPAELHDLATEWPAKVAELAAAYAAWERQMASPAQAMK